MSNRLTTSSDRQRDRREADKAIAIMQREARIQRDWDQYFCLHNSHQGLTAFIRVMRLMTDAEYWWYLRDVWVMNNSNMTNMDTGTFALLFAYTSPGRKAMMTSDERAALKAMPEHLKIYRGYNASVPNGHAGWSWTLDRSIAELFAARTPSPSVAVGICNRSDVVAYITDRDESEILVDPVNVRIQGV